MNSVVGKWSFFRNGKKYYYYFAEDGTFETDYNSEHKVFNGTYSVKRQIVKLFDDKGIFCSELEFNADKEIIIAKDDVFKRIRGGNIGSGEQYDPGPDERKFPLLALGWWIFIFVSIGIIAWIFLRGIGVLIITMTMIGTIPVFLIVYFAEGGWSPLDWLKDWFKKDGNKKLTTNDLEKMQQKYKKKLEKRKAK